MKRRKQKWTVLRFRRNDPAHNLHAAVTHWVRANGGRCVVTSGPEIQDWQEGEYKFRVAISCVGRKPKPRRKRNG